MTTLSPRLAHLLIHEDQSTGNLFMPDGRKISDTRRNNDMSGGLSPPVSPGSQAFTPSPGEKHMGLPSILPPPRFNGDRRPGTSIFSLLNEARPTSPLSKTSPPHSQTRFSPPLPATRPSTGHHIPRASPSVSILPPPPATSHGVREPPLTAPPAAREDRGAYLQQHQQQQRTSLSAGPFPRPDMFRRHSAHPYDRESSASSHTSYPMPTNSEITSGPGSRAPISRTTKACNACRSRKVRCDAGGSASGEPTACSRCRESGVECVYSGPQKKRGPCPGTVRQVGGAKSRRSSNRSSVTSIATTSVATPPSEDEAPWSARSSYGFPQSSSHWHPSHPYEHNGPKTSPPARQSVSVLSWPEIQPAIEVDEQPRNLFKDGYSMRPMSGDRKRELKSMDMVLPSLKVAVGSAKSYYAH